MKLHDICPLKGVRGSKFAVILQSEFYDFLPTRIAIPLFPKGQIHPIEIIAFDVEMGGETYIARTDLMGPFPVTALGKPVASAAAHSVEISRAINRLTTGF